MQYLFEYILSLARPGRGARRRVTMVLPERSVHQPLRFVIDGCRWALAGMVFAALLPACAFEERSVPVQAGMVVRVPPASEQERQAMAGSTRRWLSRTHRHLEHLLAKPDRRAMLTEDMIDETGRPRDPYVWLDEDPDELRLITRNFHGLLHTAQGASQSTAIDEPAPPWAGFEDVWIPVDDDVELAARLGFSADGDRPRQADCIIILPGLGGDNSVLRTRDLAKALVEHGFHVLALELRGHGQTARRYPDVYYTFGVHECQDLIDVADWLEETYPCVTGTGMVGSCWGGNLALVAAWFDQREPGDSSVSEYLARVLDPPCPKRHFTAGVLAFSPVLRWEEITDLVDKPRSVWRDPIAYFFQKTVYEMAERCRFPEVAGNLRHLIAYSFAHSRLSRAFPAADAYRLLRLLPYRNLPDGDKLERARVPTLLVSAVNDPFLSARDLSELIAQTENPIVAGLVLKGGGHVGFGPYNPAYYYSLVINFFETAARQYERQ